MQINIIQLFESDYLVLIVFIFIAYLLSRVIIPIIINISFKKLLFDDPDDIRKTHKGQIPTFGGVAIFASFLVVYSLSPFSNMLDGYSQLVAATILLFVIGLKDDLVGLDPLKKLASQIFAAFLVVYGVGISFSNLGNIFGVQEIPYILGDLLAIITIIALINAYNLIDGIDGLAASIGVISTLFYGIWFILAGHIELAALAFILSAAIGGFFWHNYSPATIFMGDTGSMVVGFLISYLTISFITLSLESPTVVFWQSASPIVACSILIVPIYDTFRVFVIRSLNGRSFLDSDRIHVHHNLIDEGFSHNQATLFLSILTLTITIIIIGLSYFLSNTALLGVLILISAILLPTNHWKRSILNFHKEKKIERRKTFSNHESTMVVDNNNIPQYSNARFVKTRRMSNKVNLNK